MSADSTSAFTRALGAFGAFACGIAVALGAYAAHVADNVAQHRMGLAALFLFAHGLASLALAPLARSRMQRIALLGLAIGVLLFSGSLTLAALSGTSTFLAPFGGSLLIVCWLLCAAGILSG
jgi:uncharacterized membrane protein YgdD (TMEM256/DUF423 family)